MSSLGRGTRLGVVAVLAVGIFGLTGQGQPTELLAKQATHKQSAKSAAMKAAPVTINSSATKALAKVQGVNARKLSKIEGAFDGLNRAPDRLHGGVSASPLLMALQKVRSPALRRDRAMQGVPHGRLRLRDTTGPWISPFLLSHPNDFLRDCLCWDRCLFSIFNRYTL